MKAYEDHTTFLFINILLTVIAETESENTSTHDKEERTSIEDRNVSHSDTETPPESLHGTPGVYYSKTVHINY